MLQRILLAKVRSAALGGNGLALGARVEIECIAVVEK
jgi:enamine deaminase RidA (YjgF/YER057c/UK114 family)